MFKRGDVTCVGKRRYPCFFQFILTQFVAERLKIPRAFVKHLEGKTSGVVSLKGPSTNIWNVRLIENDQVLFLQDGWGVFVKDHSISFGDCLVFSYEGSMLFSVEIFDTSACVKEDAFYARPSHDSTNFGIKKRTLGDHDEVVPLDCSTDNTKAQKKPMTGNGFRRCTIAAKGRMERACTDAMMFKSDRATAAVVMRMSHVAKGFFMRLPVSFCNSSLPKVTQAITLCDPRGREWQTKYIYSCGSGTLSAGWKAFAFGNNLQKHDVCVFEVIEHNKMRVHIFRIKQLKTSHEHDSS